MTHELNAHLHRAYGGFADKRYKRIQFGRAIAIDQHRDGRQINQAVHCLIFVEVFDNDVIRMKFLGNEPVNAEVRRLRSGLSSATLTSATPNAVRALAAAYRRVPVPSDHKSWYYARTEVGADLDRFAAALDDFLTPA